MAPSSRVAWPGEARIPVWVARSAGLVEVVEEKLDSGGGVAAEDLLH